VTFLLARTTALRMFLYGMGSGSDLIKIYRAFRSRPSEHLVNPREQGFNVGKSVCFHKSSLKIDINVDYRNWFGAGSDPEQVVKIWIRIGQKYSDRDPEH
jgi:hypothetical protein